MPRLGLTGLARVPLALLQRTEDYGLDRAELLRQAGLTEQELANPDSRIEVSKMWNLWRIVIERTDDPALGLHIGQGTTVRQFGLVGYMMYYSHTLDEALHRLTRYSRIISKALRVVYRTDDEKGELSFEHTHPFERTQHPADARLASVLGGIREITQADVIPADVRLPYDRPADISEHQKFFRAPLNFGAPHPMLVFHGEDLARPIVASDPTLSGYLDSLADETLSSVDNRDSLPVKVRRAIWTQLSDGSPAVAKVARTLGMSARTLQRRLHREGTSFARVLEDFRREMSAHLLRDPSLAVYEVAFLLGYSEPSTFYRAFRRWNHRSPEQFRQSLAS